MRTTGLLNPGRRVDDHMSRPLVDGVLPPPGAPCEPDVPPSVGTGPRGGTATGGGGAAGAVRHRA